MFKYSWQTINKIICLTCCINDNHDLWCNHVQSNKVGRFCQQKKRNFHTCVPTVNKECHNQVSKWITYHCQWQWILINIHTKIHEYIYVSQVSDCRQPTCALSKPTSHCKAYGWSKSTNEAIEFLLILLPFLSHRVFADFTSLLEWTHLMVWSQAMIKFLLLQRYNSRMS